MSSKWRVSAAARSVRENASQKIGSFQPQKMLRVCEAQNLARFEKKITEVAVSGFGVRKGVRAWRKRKLIPQR